MSCQGMQGQPGDLKAGKAVKVAIFLLCMETDLNSAPAPFKLSAEHFLKILEQKVDNVRAGTGGNAKGFAMFRRITFVGSSWPPQ